MSNLLATIITRQGDAASSDPSAGVIACTTVTLLFATLFIALRFYSGWFVVKKLFPEDWVILLSFLFALGLSVETYIQALLVFWQHVDIETLEVLKMKTSAQWITITFYFISLSLTRTSVLLLYTRLISYAKFRRLTYGMLGLVGALNLCSIIGSIINCTPILKHWDQEDEGFCQSASALWVITAFNVATEFLVVLLPLPIICTLRLPKQQKIGLFFFFTGGILICVISLVRVIWLVSVQFSANPVYDTAQIANWSIAEVNVAIMFACITTLKPLYKTFISRKEPQQRPDSKESRDQPSTTRALQTPPVYQYTKSVAVDDAERNTPSLDMATPDSHSMCADKDEEDPIVAYTTRLDSPFRRPSQVLIVVPEN